MKDKLINFGAFVNDKCFNKYVNEGVSDQYDEDDIVELFEEYTKNQMVKVLSKKDYIDSWIEAWVQIFPKGIKSGGKPLRSSPKDCSKKMLAFMNDYPEYDMELIMFATNEYIKQKSSEQFAYTRCASNFIGKRGEGSDLAAWCEECKTLDKSQQQLPYIPVEPSFHVNDFI